MKVVLDTNVLVSALLRKDTPPARLLDLILAGPLILLLEERIFAEYREVLRRPKFGFDPALVDDLLATLDKIGEWVVSLPWPHRLPDEDDRPFLETAASGPADVLITGNAADFGRLLPKGLRVITPADFLRRFCL